MKIFSRENPMDRISGRIIEYGLLAVIVFSPLPAASVPDWSILVIEAAIFFIAAVYVFINQSVNAETFFSRSLKWPRRLSTALILFLAFQILPLPAGLVKILSPSTLARKSLYGGGESRWLNLSMVPDRTIREGMVFFTCLLFSYLIIKTVKSRAQIFRMASVFIMMGVLEALYGLLQLYSRNPRILFYEKFYNLDSVTGTFVNRNHFSAYLEMIIPLALGLIVARMDILSSSGLRLRDFVLRFSERDFIKNLSLFLGVVVMGMALVFSKSRSGVIIFGLIFLAFLGGAVLFKERPSYQNKSLIRALQVLVVLILIMSLYAGVSATLARFDMDKISQEGRPTFWAETLRLFSRFPIFGTGLGTFSSLYPISEEYGNLYQIYHAHNDYLEYMAEIGILGSFFLFGAPLSLWAVAFRVWKTRRHPEIRGLAFGGFISVLAILFHSFTDFNMQIPANLLTFVAILSLTAAVAFHKKRDPDEDKHDRPPLKGEGWSR